MAAGTGSAYGESAPGVRMVGTRLIEVSMSRICLRTLSVFHVSTRLSVSHVAGQQPMSGGSGLSVFTAPTIEPTRLPNTGPFSIPFEVRNNGSSTIYAIVVSCIHAGPTVCNNVTPTSIPSIPPDGSVGVTLTYSVGAPGSGSIGVRASPDIG